MNMLSQQMETYTVFEDNQVLTADQLNRRMDYLEYEHRLSRVNLTGIGIVCGLAVTRRGAGITITKGCAVTSDGDLLYCGSNQQFNRFKLFEDQDGLYSLFRPGDKLIELYELVNDADALLLRDFEAQTGTTLNQIAVVLYLESYRHDPDLCTNSDCDNMGGEQRNYLKPLLIRRADMPHLLNTVPPFKRLYATLEELALPRVSLCTR